jgi:hypothetical protein
MAKTGRTVNSSKPEAVDKTIMAGIFVVIQTAR